LLAPLLAASVAAAGCTFRLLPAQGVVANPATRLVLPAQQQVTTVTVQQGNVTATQQIAGTIEPVRTALLYFLTNGKVETLNMVNGQAVHAGEVLATLNVGNLPFQISQMNLTLQRDQLQITDLENSLQTNPPTSPLQADQRMNQVQEAQMQLQADQLSQQSLQLQLSQQEIIAPFAGVLQDVNVQTGNDVGQYQVLAQLQDTSGGIWVAKLTAAQANIIAPGQPVKLSLSTDPQAALTTTIGSVQIPTSDATAIAQANSGLGGLTQPQATLATPSGYTFKASDVGAAFTGVVTVAEQDNVLFLPNSNTVFSFNGLNYVFLYKDGRTIERPVSLGLQGTQDVVITGGLKAGDAVVEQG
jgi:RND family efflux transporter MFP subunit